MARLPGWLLYDGIGTENGITVWRLRVRRWHPGFWLALCLALWRVRREPIDETAEGEAPSKV